MSVRLHITISDTTTIAVPAAPTSTVAEVIQAAVLRAVQTGFLSSDESEQQQQRFVLCGEKKTANNNNFDKKPPVLLFDSDTLQDLSAEDGWNLRLLRRNKPGSAPSATQIPLFNRVCGGRSNNSEAAGNNSSNSAQSQRFPLDQITIPHAGEIVNFPQVDPLLEIGKPEDYEIFCDASVIWRPRSGSKFGFVQVLQTVDTKHLPPHERTLFIHFRSVDETGSTTALQTERIERPPVNLMLNGFEATAVFPFAQFLKFVEGACSQDQRLSVTRIILERYEQELREYNVHPSQTQHRRQHVPMKAIPTVSQPPPEPVKNADARKPVQIAVPSLRDTPNYCIMMQRIAQGRIIRCADSSMHEAATSPGWNAVKGFKFEIPVPDCPRYSADPVVFQLLVSTASGGRWFRVFEHNPHEGRDRYSGSFDNVNDALAGLENEVIGFMRRVCKR